MTRLFLIGLFCCLINTSRAQQQDDYDPELAAQYAQFQGKTATDFSLEDLAGQKITLASLKGKVVYLHFWATWCGVCVGELPELKKLHARLQAEDPNIVFVNVVIDSEKDKWKALVAEYQVPGINVYEAASETDPKRTDRRYGFEVLPSYVIVGKDGKILGYDAPSPDDDIMADWVLLQAANGVSTRKAYEQYARNASEYVTWMKEYLRKYP